MMAKYITSLTNMPCQREELMDLTTSCRLCSERGYIDQISTLRRTGGRHYIYQEPNVACFIHFRDAFDSLYLELA